MAEAPGESEESEYEQHDDQEMEDDHESLQEQVKSFKNDDAVLEPGIANIFEDFLELGGETRSAVRHLSTSYKGLPLMINTMIEWLQLAGRRKKEIHTQIEDHLKTVILKHFDPKKADLIFTEEGSVPSWLEEMISFPTWRELFYQLADQYPDCLMLKFTIKLISDAGYQGEITSASTAAHQPEVFCGLVKNLISEIITASSSELEKSFKEFCHLVCHSQHTYFYSQAMIKTVEQRHTEYNNFTQWLSREIQQEAIRRKLDVTNMTLHFSGVGAHAKVFESLSSMLSRNALNPADVSSLYHCYTEEEILPPVRFLWNSQFLELLVQALFKPGSTVNPDHKEKYIYLLAYATSVYEREDDDDERDIIKDELTATQEAIETAHSICCSANDSHTELLSRISTLFSSLRFPIVSMGVLRWVEATLTDTSFYEISAEASSLFLVLLDEIASCNHLHHHFILDLLKRLLETSYSSMEDNIQIELKHSLVDHLIHLLSCGHVIPVVSYIHKCMTNETLEHSLVRYFVSEVLSIISPPYSQEFTTAFLPLLQNEITDTLISNNKDDLVSLFLAECPRRSKKKKRSKTHLDL